MDEPFAALDEFTRHALQDDLRRLWASAGCSVVFVTHSIYEAAYLARRIVVMSPRPGRIVDEIASTLDETGDRRLDPAYAALVAEVDRQPAPRACRISSRRAAFGLLALLVWEALVRGVRRAALYAARAGRDRRRVPGRPGAAARLARLDAAGHRGGAGRRAACWPSARPG